LGKVVPAAEVEDEELGAKMLAEAVAAAKEAHDASIADADEALQAILPWYATSEKTDDPDSLEKSYFDESSVEAPDIPLKLIPEHMEIIAETFANKFGDQPAESIFEESISSVLGKGGSGSPHASTTAAAVLERSKNCDFYMTFLNSMFREAYASAFHGGLFDRAVFNEITFNKKIDFKDCFLGFMNKDLLNKQMQNLAKKLACINIESPTRTPVNIATIKVALDALVRIISLKEIVKSLFVYNTFTSELIYDGEDSFYDTFLIAELEKAFNAQTDIDLNNEVIQQYITDIMKVIYSDDTLTDDQAFEIIKTTQLNFAKQLMFEVMPPSIAYPELKNPQTYQIVQDTEGADEADIENLELNISLQKVGIADKIQMIQNDIFASYVKVQQSKETTGVEGKSLSGGVNTLEKGALDGILFERYNDSSPSVKYYNHETMTEEETSSLKTLLQGNNSGMILEEMVKFDHNTDFWEKMTPVQQEAFKAFLFSITSDGHWQTYEELKEAADKNQGGSKEFNKKTDAWKTAAHAAIANKNALKDSILNTRLIFLFPQLINIVDSLSFETMKTMVDAPENLWKEYTNTNLFFDMFMFNRDSSYELPSYIKNPELDPDKNLGFTAHGEGARSIEWALTGKMYRSDLKNFINRLPEVDSTVDPETGELVPWYDWAIGDAPPLPEGKWGTDQTDFYSWFKAKKLNEIIKISTVISLNGYVDIESLDTFKPPSAQTPFSSAIREKIGDIKFEENGTRYYTFPVQESIEPIPSWLTVEDFLGINAIKGGRYIVTRPVFFKWFARKGVFKNGNYDLNEVLFHTLTAEEIEAGFLQGNDIYTYLVGLEAITGVDIAKETAITEYLYKSTDWTNIRGKVVSYQDILKHVSDSDNWDGVGAAHQLKSDPMGGPELIDGLNFKTAIFDKDPYAYLTPGSRASLIEDSDFWFDEQGFLKPVDTADNILPMRPDIYDDVRGYSLEGDIYHNAEARKIIGTWEATNPITAKKVILPKYIRINHRYHLRLDDEGQMGNLPKDDLEVIKEKAKDYWDDWVTKLNPTTNSAPFRSHLAKKDVNMSQEDALYKHQSHDGQNLVLLPQYKNKTGTVYKDTNLMITKIWRRHGPVPNWNLEKLNNWEATYGASGWPKNSWNKIKYRLNVPRNIMDMTHGSTSKNWVYGIESSSETPFFNEVESYGFKNIQDYLLALRELKHLVFRHSMNYNYDIDDDDKDDKKEVLERSTGHLDIDWGWDFWKTKYDNYSINNSNCPDCVPNFGNYITSRRNPANGAYSENKVKAMTTDYPGTEWLEGVWYRNDEIDSVNHRPAGNDLPPSLTYPGNKTGTAHFTHTVWNKGFIKGGLYSADKILTPIPLDGTIRFNMYNVFEQVSRTYATHAHTSDEPHGHESLRSPGIDNLVKSFFVKEQFTIVAVIQRLLAEKNYPELDRAFNGSIRKATEILIAAMASAQGDYRKVSMGSKDDELTLKEALENTYEFGKLIVKAVITATANTVDPTWVTPWFLPGPFTPFGVIAKYMHADFDDDESPGRPLAFVPPIYQQCEDKLDEQIDLLAEITEKEKPK
jgi:hypothetical protein